MALARRSMAIAAVALAFATPARSDPVTDWNQIALNATGLAAGGNTWYQTRTLAHTHAAIFDAVNSIDRRYEPYVADLKAPAGASVDAAIASAAHTVLVSHVPAQKTALDRALDAALAKVPEGASKTDGIAVGKDAAAKLLASRANDRAFDTAVFQVPAAAPGVWQQTPQFTVPIFYACRQIQPMAIKRVDSYDIGGPPKLDSEQFAKDYEEVKTLGARNSATRTPEQTATAIYWTVMTLIPWNRAAQAAAKERNLSVVDSARLFALLNMAAHDAQVAGAEQKYRYNFWRPYNAIRYPGGPGGSLKGDPNWEPLINTPGFPDYPSGHCITSGRQSRRFGYAHPAGRGDPAVDELFADAEGRRKRPRVGRHPLPDGGRARYAHRPQGGRRRCRDATHAPRRLSCRATQRRARGGRHSSNTGAARLFSRKRERRHWARSDMPSTSEILARHAAAVIIAFVIH